MVKREGIDHNNLHVGNYIIEKVQEFKYLGNTLNNQNHMHGEINFRLSAAKRCLYSLKTLLKSRLLSKKKQKTMGNDER